jgi:hypothetical protein
LQKTVINVNEKDKEKREMKRTLKRERERGRMSWSNDLKRSCSFCPRVKNVFMGTKSDRTGAKDDEEQGEEDDEHTEKSKK